MCQGVNVKRDFLKYIELNENENITNNKWETLQQCREGNL